MRTAAFVAALVGSTFAAPQAVTHAVAPNEKSPDGCQSSYPGSFQVVVSSLQKRSLEARQSTPLEVTLKDGVMTDSKGRTGYIADNQQFQFDGPAQSGALYTAGWTVCANGSIALGNSAVFYQCLSGTFYNLYDEDTAKQCSAVFLTALGSASSATSGAPAGAVASPGAHTVVCQIGDGQIQQDTCITTATAPPTSSTQPTGAVVTQISDGQVQAPVSGASTAAVTSAPATAPASATNPGVLAPTGAVVSQIGDGQVQAGNSSVVAVKSPTVSAAVVSTASHTAAATPAAATGGAVVKGFRTEVFGLAAAVAAVAFLL